VNRSLQFLFQHGMNAALAFDPGKTLKGAGYQAHMEMGFAMAAIVAGGAGMAGVTGAFVPHLQRQRRKGGGQFLRHGVGDFHPALVCFAPPKVKQYVSLSFTLASP